MTTRRPAGRLCGPGPALGATARREQHHHGTPAWRVPWPTGMAGLCLQGSCPSRCGRASAGAVLAGRAALRGAAESPHRIRQAGAAAGRAGRNARDPARELTKQFEEITTQPAHAGQPGWMGRATRAGELVVLLHPVPVVSDGGRKPARAAPVAGKELP